MATSPPFAGSPPGSTISLPKKRPSLGAPNPSSKRRKQSAAGPSLLRQTSFPPENLPGQGSRSPSVDSNIVATPSVVSGVSGLKKKRKSKAAKGGDEGSAIGSGIASRKGGSAIGTAAGSTLNAAGAEDDVEEEEDINEAGALVEGGKMDEAAQLQEKQNLKILFEAFTPDQQERYTMWRRVKLNREKVRRLTNHTVSQSVPVSIITTITAYSKVFIGELIEKARDIQLEWQACENELPTREAIDPNAPIKDRTKEENRGPLTPDHIREALRRYKKDREGGSAGFLGLSLQANGRENVAARAGGRKLFR